MSINVSGSYIEIARLVRAGLDLKKEDLVEKIVRQMRKSKYDDSGLTWYFTLDNEEINEMDNIISESNTFGFSELVLNYLRAKSKLKEVNKDE